ncbi:mediator complex subunit 15 domain-containing protein [Hominiventricola filiformis]|uniref:Uncharacterized protein n=1 Tax=Hominiventricola filiformis TaxID=2885352 RepID=A0AAE3A479_9FIRM|nr:hypothetical protein [Hominiventricola filiformis]MCC2125701.1 hypothetical protein [Hominiventricola filiformis]
MNNQFQDFSNRMIAKHKGFGQTFDSAPMVFPEQESAGETGGTSIENHYIKNLYQIQNLTEENHLYHQNLRFVTNILEKKLEQRVVPSVEKLVERTIQEELPGVEKQIVHEMAERLHTLVKEGGVKELTMLREQLYKETERQKEQLYRETERQEKLLHKETEVRTEKLAGKLERELRITERLNKTEHEIQTGERKLSVEQNRHTETTNLTEQEILLRKIENIYYSSTQNHFYENAEQAGEQTENSPERTKVWTRELQTQALQTPALQTPTLEAQKAPQRSFDFLHLEYGVQDSAEETANTQAQSKPDTPEFLKQQERVLEQQREIIARQFRSLTQQAEGAVVARNKEQQERLLLQQTVSAIQNKPQLQSTTVLQNIEPSQDAAPLQNVESSQDAAVSLQNVEPAQSEAREPDIYDKTLTVPEHRSRSIFRVEDLKRHQHQPDRTFQEAELLYSFEQTSDEHWNEIRQEIVKELREDKNREFEKPSEEPSVHQPTSTSVPRARELADQIFRQARENIRLQTGGTITIHPAALEYLEQVLDTQSGQSKQAVQPVGKQLQLTDRKSSDENTVIHRVERILDAYRVRQEPVKAAARSTKPKTMMTQAPAGVRSGEPGTMMVQQPPGQSGTMMVQQIPGQSETMMVQQIPGQSGTMMVQQPPGQSETMMVQQIPGQSETVMIQQTMAGQSGQPGAVRSQPQMTSRPETEMLRIKSQMPQAIRLIQVPEISVGEVKAAMEQAPMIYPEEVSPQEQAEQNQNLQKQIHEITQDIKEVKKTTVVRQETLTEQQKEVVREVIRQAPETVKEKDVSTLIRRQVQREVETQVDASLGQMTNRVYRRIEEKLRTERGRRGLL